MKHASKPSRSTVFPATAPIVNPRENRRFVLPVPKLRPACAPRGDRFRELRTVAAPLGLATISVL